MAYYYLTFSLELCRAAKWLFRFIERKKKEFDIRPYVVSQSTDISLSDKW